MLSEGERLWKLTKDKDPDWVRAGENTTCPKQGILRGDEKAKTSRQLVVGISRWSASLPEMEQQSQTKTPSRREEDSRTGPSAGVLGQAGERSLSPSARKWNKERIKALSSFHLEEGQEAEMDGDCWELEMLYVKVKKGDWCSTTLQDCLPREVGVEMNEQGPVWGTGQRGLGGDCIKRAEQSWNLMLAFLSKYEITSLRLEILFWLYNITEFSHSKSFSLWFLLQFKHLENYSIQEV